VSTELAELGEVNPTPTGPGLLTVLWRRKAYLVLGAVVGLGLGYLDYLRRDRVYQSAAQLYVQKRRADPLPATPGSVLGPNSQMAFIEDFLATHEALIKSTEVLTLATKYLERVPLEKPPPGGDYVGYIASGLSVNREKTGNYGTSANILNISFRGPSPVDSEIVVNAVIEGYRDSLGDGVRNVTKGDLEQIQRALAQIEEETKDLDQKQLARKNLLPSLDWNPFATNPDPKQSGLRNLTPAVGSADLKARINVNEVKRGELVLREIEVKNRQKLVNEAKKEGKDRRTLLALLQRSGDGRTDRPVEARMPEEPLPLVTLRLQEQELLDSLGKDHPQVIALRRRIEALREQTPVSSTDELVEFFLQVMAQELEAIKLQTEFLDGELKKDRDSVQWIEESQLEAAILADHRDRLRKRRSDLEDRQKQIELTQEARLYDARPINPPGPGGKVSPILLQCLLLSVALCMMGGGGLAYLAEMTDKSFRNPDEIRRRLGLAVIGHIPALSMPKAGLLVPAGKIDARIVVHHRPKSAEAEAFRGVRTALYFSTKGKGHQVIQITSPNPGDGKSTLSANLAVAIAQSGKRVVLVDCDFRKPKVHKIFGVNPDVGLASVIAGDADLAGAIQSCEVPGLSLLPCGPRPANPAELLTSQRFQELLDEIKPMFDFVLIDTPPLLAVSDPAVVAARVDGVLLTIRITRKTRPAAERARETLAAMGANIIGVVVNDLQTGNGSGLYGYSYGSGNGYGYGSRYAYNYQYGYAESYGESADDSGVFPQLNGKPHAPTAAIGG
jgi:polysaccharide biosynthesis transport protein